MSKRKKSFDKHAHLAWPETSVLSALPLGVLTGAAIIVLAVFIIYLPSLSGGFVLDDDKLLTENRLVMASDGLYRFWRTTDAQDYWPVTNTSFWIEWRVWKMNTTGYHVTNLILHIVESLLIWIILRKLSIPGAFLAALIFAVHPVNVESVAWIAQRKNTMAMLFFLLSILWYLKYFSHPSRDLWYWLSLVAFMLAMLSKGSVVVLPVLLLGIICWLRLTGNCPNPPGDCPDFRGAKMGLSPLLSPLISKSDLLQIPPFFVIAIGLTGVNLWFQTHGLEIVVRNVGFLQRVLGAGGVIWFYLYKALLPFDLVFVYPQWHIEVGNLLWWLPLIAAAIVTAVLWRYRKTWSRPILFAWGFFCVSLVPVLGFTDVGFMKYSLVADHYQHIAIIGVIALVAARFCTWYQQKQRVAQLTSTVFIFVTVGTLAFLTWRQNGLYRNAMSLYQATLDKNPNCWMAYNNLGNVFYALRQYQPAIEHYEKALCLNPDYPEAHNNLGNVFYVLHQYQPAIEHYEKALILNPDYFKAHYNLANSFKTIGKYQQAVEHYRQALRLQPDYVDAHNNLGIVLFATGRLQEAIDHYEQALRLRPDFAITYNNLALAYARMHKSAEAIEMAQKALQLAKSQGQTELVKQINGWLDVYQKQVNR